MFYIHGSVATQIKHSGVFDNYVIANFL